MTRVVQAHRRMATPAKCVVAAVMLVVTLGAVSGEAPATASRADGTPAIPQGSQADATIAFRQAFEEAARTGGYFRLDHGFYRLTDSVEIPPGLTVDGDGSTVVFEIPTTRKGFCLKDRCTLKNMTVEVDTVGSSFIGNGEYGQPISVGDYNPGRGYSKVVISDVTVKSQMTGGVGIMILGDSHDITIRNIHVLSSPNAAGGIAVHWGNLLGIDTLADTGTTTHPSNIVIDGVVIDSLTSGSSFAIWLSGAYSARISNVTAKQVFNGIQAYVGDFGFRYSKQFGSGPDWRGRGFTIAKVNFPRVAGTGIHVWGRASGAFGSRVPDSVRVFEIPSTLENVSISGIDSNQAHAGFSLEYASDALVQNCEASGFATGIAVSAECRRDIVSNCSFHDNFGPGISISHGAHRPSTITLENNRIVGNDRSWDFRDQGGIYLGNSFDVRVFGNNVGDNGETGQFWGIRVSPEAGACTMVGNKVKGLKDSVGAAAYRIDCDSSVTAFSANSGPTGRNFFSGQAKVPKLDTSKIVAPKVTESDRDLMTNIVEGQLIFNLDRGCFQLRRNGRWESWK